MTDVTTIPLNKLTAWDGNVRKTDPAGSIDELVASIAAHGLLQSLVVRKPKRGKCAVIAGRRRFLALKALAEAGTISADFQVPCHMVGSDADAAEISLVENTVREPMHPADEFEAFRDLVDNGMPVADIAARFGVTDTVVQKRLKLARVNPVIVDAFREGDLTLEAVMAFACVDDHAAQEQVFENLCHGWDGDPDDIRDALTQDDVAATDKRVRFVTLEAYEAAGGGLRRDLFASNDRGVYILDPLLLDRLVADKLQESAAALQAEGWKWIEIRPEFDWNEWSDCKRCRPEPAPLPDDEAAELAGLEAERDNLLDDDDDGENTDRLDAIERRIEELEDREAFYAPEILAIAGAILTVSYDGDLDIRRGYIHPEDTPETAEIQNSGEDSPRSGSGKHALSARLTTNLTAHRSAALSAMLADNPDIALAATVHALAIDVLYGGHGDTCLMLSATRRNFASVQGSKAFDCLDDARMKWGDRLPGDAEAFWSWCLEQHRDTLLDLLAFCAASSVNIVVTKSDRADSGSHKHGEALAAPLSLDMRDWFTATAENYFGHISKKLIQSALQEALDTAPAPAWDKLKKSELASLAERQISGKGWLPVLLLPAVSAVVAEADTVEDKAA